MRDWIPDRYRELRSLLGLRRPGEDVDEELEHHLEMRMQENLDAGMSRAEARAEALRRFGDLERVRRETREIDERLRRRRERRDHMDAVFREVRVAARSLTRRPGFSVIAVLTLALGIGSVSAIYTVLDRVVLSPLPYPEADELVWVQSRVPYVGSEARWGLSEAGYFYFKEQNRTLEALGAFSSGGANLAGEAGPARVRVAAVTASLLDAIGARSALGRLIQDDDAGPGGRNVVVLGHGFWVRQYGGDPGVLGQTVELDATAYEVIGVMAEGVNLPDQPIDVWRPLNLDPSRPPVNAHWLAAIARLRDGVSGEEAEADLARLTGRFTELFPSAYSETFMRESGFSTEVVPLRDRVIGDAARVLWVLFGAVAVVLLIAGANVTNLFLVRTEARRRELAIRAALGAGRGHLARHYVTEGLMLALTGGAIGLGLAYLAVRLIVRLTPSGLPRLAEIGLDASVIAFTAGISIAGGLILGALPLAYRLVHFDALREGGRGLAGSRRRLLTRRAMVTGQVALALVLLTAAGLMLRSFHKLRDVEPGFEAENVLALEVSLPPSIYPGYEEVNRFYREFLARIEALPGVVRAGATQKLPLYDLGGCAAIFVEDRRLGPNETPPCVATPQATPGFFAALGISVRGSAFDWSDVEARAGGAVVTRALAERLWPGEDAIGKGIRGNGWARPFYRVIGVTEDVRGEGLDRPPSQVVYFPMLPMEGAYLWMPPRSMRVVVEAATAEPEALMPAIRRVLSELDPTVPLANVQTMETVIARSPAVARASFTMLLLGIAGALALVLSAVGLYGVIAYAVSQRTTEIGVRVALGARLGQVVRMVLGQSLKLTVAGVAAGLLVALAISRLLRSLLFEVSPTDPLTLTAVAGLLMIIALAAAYVPARRAGRVDPMEALRAE